MRVDIVVDVGNTRIKWGRCSADAVTQVAALAPNDPAGWEQQLKVWSLAEPLVWAIAGVHPLRSDGLTDWLRHRGHRVWVADSPFQLPLSIAVNAPKSVGMDRLLNAVAAARHPSRGKLPAIVVDAGSAVTVDWIERDGWGRGSFGGGAILPGYRLMGKALHDYTALLPMVEPPQQPPAMPGRSTPQAIEAGIHHAVSGGVNQLVRLLIEDSARHTQGTTPPLERPPAVFVTGGDGWLLARSIEHHADYWPEMTLEGIRLTADAQPEPTEASL